MSEVLQVKKLSEFAVIPSKGSPFSAGYQLLGFYFSYFVNTSVFFYFVFSYDLSSAYDCSVPARGKALVKTDLAISIPENTYARIGK